MNGLLNKRLEEPKSRLGIKGVVGSERGGVQDGFQVFLA